MAVRDALIVAVARYGDRKLQRLRAPAADAARLCTVLADPMVGDFQVTIASDETDADLRRRLARFFSDRAPDDLLLVHFSCHGIKDDKGELYLATVDTDSDPDLLAATAIGSSWLSGQIDRCRSKRIVVLLDCCFSGSFRLGFQARAGGTISIGSHLGGRGRAVLTASNAMEYAFEGDRLSGAAKPSIFTGAVVEGLETGRADQDEDGWISIDELYDYVYDRVREQTPGQTPTKLSQLEGTLYIARSNYRPPVQPITLDPEILQSLHSHIAGVRLRGVHELARLVDTSDPAVIAAARDQLKRMVEDDDQIISTHASQALLTLPGSDTEQPPTMPVSLSIPPPAANATEEWSGRLRQVLKIKHSGGITAVALSPDGRRIATASWDGTARVWDITSRSTQSHFAHALARTPGKFIDFLLGRIPLSQVNEFSHELIRFNHKATVRHVAFSPDGRRIATTTGDYVARVWEVTSGIALASISHDNFLNSVAFSPNGRHIATASEDGTARVWEVASRRQLTAITHDDITEKNGIVGLAFSPDAQHIATGSRDGTARVWKLDSGRELTRFTHDSWVCSVAFSPTARQIATASTDGTARVWNITDESEPTIVSHEKALHEVAFSPDGRQIATASNDMTVRLWNPADGSELVRLAHNAPVICVAFSADGRYIITATTRATRVWKAIT